MDIIKLSIDSKWVREIEITIKSEKKEVRCFLENMKEIINDKNFNIENDFILIQTMKADKRYSTTYTLLDLEYDSFDVIECLKQLSITNYSETLFDKDDDNPPLLYVFGMIINGHLVYIKLKMKGEANKKILCVSFHYAKWEMNFPFA